MSILPFLNSLWPSQVTASLILITVTNDPFIFYNQKINSYNLYLTAHQPAERARLTKSSILSIPLALYIQDGYRHQPYTLMEPTVTRPVQDPLAVKLLDNRLYATFVLRTG